MVSSQRTTSEPGSVHPTHAQARFIRNHPPQGSPSLWPTLPTHPHTVYKCDPHPHTLAHDAARTVPAAGGTGCGHDRRTLLIPSPPVHTRTHTHSLREWWQCSPQGRVHVTPSPGGTSLAATPKGDTSRNWKREHGPRKGTLYAYNFFRNSGYCIKTQKEPTAPTSALWQWGTAAAT